MGGIVALNLRFDTRPRSDVTLQRMFAGGTASFDETSMGQTYDVVMRFFQRYSLDEVGAFTKALLSSVKVLRVVVPQDTDLNHYFEIMNNRGEQLEKHEVLKARLMSQLPPGRAQRTFAIIWDACADMRRHVQMGFSAALRVPLFGESLDRAPRDFTAICSLVTDADNVQEGETLADILNSSKTAAAPAPGAEQEGTSDEARAPIIDFANFLLYALHAFTGKRVALDDKRLLDAFDEHRPDPSDFVHVLLKYRLLFDRFVVRRWDGKWNLKTLKYSRQLNQYSYLNSIEDNRVLTQLTMLLSMFHVSFPSQSYKHWLDATLVYLY